MELAQGHPEHRWGNGTEGAGSAGSLRLVLKAQSQGRATPISQQRGHPPRLAWGHEGPRGTAARGQCWHAVRHRTPRSVLTTRNPCSFRSGFMSILENCPQCIVILGLSYTLQIDLCVRGRAGRIGWSYLAAWAPLPHTSPQDAHPQRHGATLTVVKACLARVSKACATLILFLALTSK